MNTQSITNSELKADIVSKLNAEKSKTEIGTLRFLNRKLDGMDVNKAQEISSKNVEFIGSDEMRFLSRFQKTHDIFFNNMAIPKKDIVLNIETHVDFDNPTNQFESLNVVCEITKTTSGTYRGSAKAINSIYGDAEAHTVGKSSAGDALTALIQEIRRKLESLHNTKQHTMQDNQTLANAVVSTCSKEINDVEDFFKDLQNTLLPK